MTTKKHMNETTEQSSSVRWQARPTPLRLQWILAGGPELEDQLAAEAKAAAGFHEAMRQALPGLECKGDSIEIELGLEGEDHGLFACSYRVDLLSLVTSFMGTEAEICHESADQILVALRGIIEVVEARLADPAVNVYTLADLHAEAVAHFRSVK